MPSTRTGIAVGFVLSASIGVVFAVSLFAGMASSGLEGAAEVTASILFLLTLPAAAIAAMFGRLALPLGVEIAFVVTGLAWMLLSIPYGVLLVRALNAMQRMIVGKRESERRVACESQTALR